MIHDLRAAARALSGEVTGGEIICPGPGHGPRDRSLSVRLSASSPERFLVHSFAGDPWQDCRDHVARLLGIERERGPPTRSPQADRKRPAPREDEGDRHALRIAASIATGIAPLRGTPGETYLRDARKIDANGIADVLEGTDAIGWNPSVLFREPGSALDGKWLGAIIGIMTDPISAEPTGGVSRTYLHEGCKVGKAKNLGPAGIVRVTPDEDVTRGLFLVEGLETALAAISKGLRPAWSTGSTSIMAKMPVLSGIESITILADNDENGAGERAANEAERRWKEAGREARIWVPPTRGDFNDLLVRGAL
jgi:putative DNA primase/helicase